MMLPRGQLQRLALCAPGPWGGTASCRRERAVLGESHPPRALAFGRERQIVQQPGKRNLNAAFPQSSSLPVMTAIGQTQPNTASGPGAQRRVRVGSGSKGTHTRPSHPLSRVFPPRPHSSSLCLKPKSEYFLFFLKSIS